MKKYIFLVAALFLQVLWASPEILGMDNASSCYNQPEEQRNIRLKCAFERIFEDVKVKIDGAVVKFKGTQEAVQNAIGELGDFTKLRKKVIPVSGTINTQAYAKQKFASWGDCLQYLGIQPEAFKLFDLNSAIDEENSLTIPYEEADREFADVYINKIKKLSPYFEWISKNNPQLITYSNKDLAINYSILNDHFCDSSEQEFADDGTSATATLPLKSVLKKLMAAAGGEISLTPSKISGHFHVQTVTLGNNLVRQPVIKFCLDKSGSMKGTPIETINSTIPLFLEKFQNQLKGMDSLRVNIYAFNTTLELVQSFDLKPNSEIPKFHGIRAHGSTDLTLIGKLYTDNKDPCDAFVALTDGTHTEEKTSPLNNSLESIKEVVETGSFPQLKLFKVSNETKPEKFFQDASDIVAGAYSDHKSIYDFCNEASQSIPSLLVSKEPLVLTLSGTKVVVWQENAKPDIHVTKSTGCHQDSIMRGGTVLRVNTTSFQPEGESEETKLEAEIARMQERLKTLKTEGKK